MLSTLTISKVSSEHLGMSVEVGRVIGYLKGETPGATNVFLGGMHGNEPAGVFALAQVIAELQEENIPLAGNVVALAGNLPALSQGLRFIDSDMNRMWTHSRMQEIRNGIDSIANADQEQQVDLHHTIRSIMNEEEGPFYFMDLHTTSSDTAPFLAVNDSSLNRKFTSQYPSPIILGIEEYITGPILSYINELGYVSFGFEGGQHDNPDSVENHKAFIYLTLVFTGTIKRSDIDFDKYYARLAERAKQLDRFYEIYFRYHINRKETFKMRPGLSNFEIIPKGDFLASSNGTLVYAHKKFRLFMPLYQPQGNDGYFKIRRIPIFALKLSMFLRKFKFDRVLPLLPGVRRGVNQSLVVNRHVAALLTKQLFHLLGYRTREADHDHYVIRNREFASRDKDYTGSAWYKT